MTVEQFLNSPPVGYSIYWGSSGNSHQDYREVVGDGEPPEEVLIEGSMLCLIWKDRIVVTGYDGHEYYLTFDFDRDPIARDASPEAPPGPKPDKPRQGRKDSAS